MAAILKRVLQETSIKSFVESKELKGSQLISLSPTTRLDDAIDTLSINFLQAVPVVDDQAPADKRYLGFLTQFDLVVFILRKCCEEPCKAEAESWVGLSSTAPPGSHWDKHADDLRRMEKAGTSFKDTLVKDIMGESWNKAASEFMTVSADQTLWDALTQFAKGIPRVGVLDDRGNLVHVVTQSDIVSVLAMQEPDRLRELGTIGDKPSKSKLVRLHYSAPTVHAFFMMHEHEVSQIAVIDDYNKLMASISATDAKRLKSDNLTSILEPLMKFCVGNPGWLLPPITATPTTPFQLVVEQLSTYGIHQIFMVDADNHPVGVVTTGDICDTVYHL
jgi:CBS domain-containing protein